MSNILRLALAPGEEYVDNPAFQTSGDSAEEALRRAEIIYGFTSIYHGLTPLDVPVSDYTLLYKLATSENISSEYPLSENDLRLRFQEWVINNFGASLSDLYPNHEEVINNILAYWYTLYGFNGGIVPNVGDWEVAPLYQVSVLNPNLFKVLPPFYFDFEIETKINLVTIQLTQKILVPIQFLQKNGKSLIYDTFDEITKETSTSQFYRLLQIYLADCAVKGTIDTVNTLNFKQVLNGIRDLLKNTGNYKKALYPQPTHTSFRATNLDVSKIGDLQSYLFYILGRYEAYIKQYTEQD